MLLWGRLSAGPFCFGNFFTFHPILAMLLDLNEKAEITVRCSEDA